LADVTDGMEQSLNPPGAAPRIIANRYEIVRVLGEGSSARTLLCRDLRDDRQVAVKELHIAHLENWKFLELFEREASMLAKLDHPGIPRVYDFFQRDGEAHSLYIVQELIEGVSLQQRMETGPMLGQQEIRDLALGVLEVLQYLHGRAPPVLHRDIKPSNVLLRPEGRPALIDFGGVCFGWRLPGSAGTTVVGTFGYMPPEQLVGQSGPTSDLYALGATLLHVLTGRPPSQFPFDSGRIEVPPDLPAARGLVKLVEATLRPAPRDRPQTAEAARRILLDDSTSHSGAVAVSTVNRPPSPVRRNVAITSGDGPRFVDMGDPPRDPKGPFSDVYRNLMHPLFPARRLWSSGVHVVWVGFAGAMSIVTVGVFPAIYAWRVSRRRKKFDELFRHGHFTTGTLRSQRWAGTFAHFRYEFEVEGSSYLATMEYAQEMARYWDAGDTVPVLYDPDDPTLSCFVYR
jgi:serine/threonine protein kinase